ncbi:hypothetical protein BH10BAC4_BH10BAC4_03050 [soil metagenome]
MTRLQLFLLRGRMNQLSQRHQVHRRSEPRLKAPEEDNLIMIFGVTAMASELFLRKEEQGAAHSNIFFVKIKLTKW